MAFTATDLDNLDKAIASGELTVRLGDQQVTYRSLDELQKARTLVAKQLDAQAYPNRRPIPRHQLADFSDC